MTRLTEKEARAILGDMYTEPPKKLKYNAQKLVVDGIRCPSIHEAEYYCTLKIRVRAGEIVKFELQPEFILQEGYMRNGKKVREIKYISDFRVYYTDGREEIVDTKGYRTKEYKLKKKMLLD